MMRRPLYRTFNSFLQERFGQRVQKITLDAGLSCPNRDEMKRGGCIYCNAAGSGTGAMSRGVDLRGQIETQMKVMSRRYGARAFIAYFQSYSNTYADLPTLQANFDAVLPYPEIVGIAVGTRPDCIDRDRLGLISSYAPQRLVWMEYGLQSASDKTLKLIRRGHDADAFIRAVRLTADFPLRICAHVIIGLPGEGMDDFLATAALVSSLPVTDVKIHLLYIVRGTELERMYRTGEYEPMDMPAYAQAAARFIAHLRKDIVVQRITGDPHEEELIEPRWALDKRQALDAVHREMELSGLVQGSLYTEP